MKLVQAMKQIKDLVAKAEGLRAKVAANSATLSIETPAYVDQKAQIREWLQAHHDVLKEVERLRVAIQRTNIDTEVTIEIAGNIISKPLAAWIHRRRDLARLERDAWSGLTDRGLKEQNVQTATGGPITEIRIVRHFSSSERDKNVETYRSEPSVIDGTLEIVNAVTDLKE